MDAIFGLDQIEAVAAVFLKKCKSHKIWAFHAPMGAGKTTFINALCKQLGVKEGFSSPTFSIVNEYATDNGPVYHMDWYRLQSESEAIDAGIEDILDSGAYCFVEWPENAPGLLGPEVLHLYLGVLDPSTRRLFKEDTSA